MEASIFLLYFCPSFFWFFCKHPPLQPRSNEAAKEAIFYSYNRHINAFAAVLDQKVAEDIAKHRDVVSVHENKKLKLHTTRSWNFLGVENDGGIPLNSLWNLHDSVNLQLLATLTLVGVWPESKSFSDEGYGPIPTRWKGSCEGGTNFSCNRKLIGARYFNKGFASDTGPLNSSYETARDVDGHGTHTLSTAGGNFVKGVSILGNSYGTVKGGSPKALVAAYKVCWSTDTGDGCFMADILASFEAAISDGVDVLSVSLGGGIQEFSDDLIAIGSFHAVKNGITVVCSAANSGPSEGTVLNVAPWIITVGASTVDRLFTSYVVLGDKRQFKGESLSSKLLPPKKFYPLIRALDAKSNNTSSTEATPIAYMTQVTELGIKPAPIMASFSSRGPNTVEPSILKPDITAPGVDIIAAFSEAASLTDLPYDERHTQFITLSGTSMSCPHISGIVGLLKTLYPNWSPAAIRSAIMTTAGTEANDLNPILSSEKEKANPLAYGADLNYPSISMNNLKSEAVEIKRRVKNVGSPGTYVAQVEAPPGVSVSVDPNTLKFTKTDEEKDFKVVLKRVSNNQTEGHVFGKLVWSDGKHRVSSPIFVILGI
ncbi:Subtilisin-like protease 5.3, partial [Cucurbita argyrosperma subsp. sororia]